MSDFSITNEISYPLKDTNQRFWHLATIHYSGIRSCEFIYFEDRLTGKRFIEERVADKNFKQIEDELLWQALTHYLEEKGFTTVFLK